MGKRRRPDHGLDTVGATMSGQDQGLAERQERERAYHAEFARKHQDKIDVPVLLDVIEPGPRRPWNGYWSAYDRLMEAGLAGKRVMIPGCGFGEDAIRLAKLGCVVHASDLSPELLDIAARRAERMGVPGIHFDLMPAETLAYDDDFFDIVFFNDILHHVTIPAAVAEARRVARPGALVVVNELYTHSALQRVRDSRLVAARLYPRMVKRIYGTEDPYITEDEHKIDEAELAVVESMMGPGIRRRYFMLVAGRLVPPYHTPAQKFDVKVLNSAPAIGRLLAGRIVVSGTVGK